METLDNIVTAGDPHGVGGGFNDGDTLKVMSDKVNAAIDQINTVDGIDASRIIYVSDVGNDANSGLSSGAPIATAARLAELLLPGGYNLVRLTGTVDLTTDLVIRHAMRLRIDAFTGTPTLKFTESIQPEAPITLEFVNLNLEMPSGNSSAGVRIYSNTAIMVSGCTYTHAGTGKFFGRYFAGVGHVKFTGSAITGFEGDIFTGVNAGEDPNGDYGWFSDITSA